MHIVFVILLAIVILLWVIGRNKKQKNIDTSEKFDEKIEMEELFCYEIKNGEKMCKLANIIDQFDLVFIKSLFQSRRIPYNIELDHTSDIWPSMKIVSSGNVNIYILEKNYDDVIKLIEEYKKNVPNDT